MSKTIDKHVVYVECGEESLDDYMSKTFGCSETDDVDLPTDEPSLIVYFERADIGVSDKNQGEN